MKPCKHCGLTTETATPKQLKARHFTTCDKHQKVICEFCGICKGEPANAVTKQTAAKRIAAANT